MPTMRYHFWNDNLEREQTVKVFAPSIEDCIEIAENEIEGAGFEIMGYYQIDDCE